MSARSDESGARHKFFDEFGVAVHAAEVQPTVIDDHAKFLLSRLKQKLKQRLKGGPGEVRRTFSYLDKSKTGKVDREDLRHVFHDIGIVLEKKDELALMQFFDRSKTGDISLDEFVAWFESSDDRPVSAAKFNSADARENRQAHAQNIRDKIASGGQLGMQMIAAVRDKVHSRIATGPYQLRRAFKHFDRDGSGSISVHEFTHVMRNFGFNLSKKEIAVLFNLFDLNGDGSLDYYEFIDIVLPQDYDAAEHPLGRAIARQPGPWSMELVREGEFLPRKLQDRTSNVYQRFGKAIAAYDPNRTGIVSVTDFVDAIKRMEWAYWGEDEQQEIIKKLVDDNGQVHYAAFLDALEKDTFMTQPISKFLRPKQMRSNADIFQNRGAGVAESRPAKRITAPEVQPPLDRAGWDEIEQSKNFGISAKEMVQRTNPLVIPSMLGAPKRFVFGPLPSDIQPEFAYGIQNGPSDNITDVVSNAFGRQALVHARLREAIEVDRRNKKFRPPGGHTRSSLLRASAIQNKMKTQNARRLRDAAAAVNGQGVSALEQAALGW
jgi:Ca2+-binding EF-hand superfamily protein